MNKVLLISPNTVKGYGDINNNVSDEAIAASIRTAQNVYLQDVLGEELLNRVKDMVADGSIDEDDNEPYKVLLDEYITECLAYKVASELCLRGSLKIRNYGVAKDGDTNIYTPTFSEVKHLQRTYDTYYSHYLNRMIDYLKKYKHIFGDGCTCEPKNKGKYGSTGLWLG